jgi:hypothetical protein
VKRSVYRKEVSRKMKELDMSKYKPFKVYEEIETRKIKDRRMKWASFEPQRYGPFTIRPIKDDREEFEKTADMWRRSFPELYGGLYDFLLYPEQYPIILGEREEFLKGEWFLLVGEEESTNRITGGHLMRMFSQNMAIEWSVAAIDPGYRRRTRPDIREMWESRSRESRVGLLRLYDDFTERCGAEYAYTFLTTAHTATQEDMLSVGFKIVGIMPGFIAGWMRGDEYCRIPVVWAQKFYNGAEKMVPDEMELIPEAKKLWDVISAF